MAARMTAAQALAHGIPLPLKQRKHTAKGKAADDTARRLFVASCQAHGLPVPVAEARFHPTRLWRLDWLWSRVADGWPAGIALEIEGGVWSRGRHTRGKGFIEDLAKYNAAALLGFIVLRVTPQQVESGEAFQLVAQAHKVYRFEWVE